MELNLHSVAGLPIYLDRDCLELGGLVVSENVEIRSLGQMKDLVWEFQPGEETRPLYYMYRDVHLRSDQNTIRNRGLRYDLTIIPPGKIGSEYVKTAGHYHPKIIGSELTYPEVYEVLLGEAHYLLQKKAEDSDEAERVVLICAKTGDKVFIPSGYGHITINPSHRVLMMANWVAREFKSVYEPIRRKKGGAYYELEEDGESRWIPNLNYRNLPPLEVGNTIENKEFSFRFAGPLYRVLDEDRQLLDVLVKPRLFH